MRLTSWMRTRNSWVRTTSWYHHSRVTTTASWMRTSNFMCDHHRFLEDHRSWVISTHSRRHHSSTTSWTTEDKYVEKKIYCIRILK
ncbi:unnamed protein product [Callosobruchus maculatus]|uniref:Uncharacterized protein n=1 Tax=Callosobruchus maculatus TaxID=64391 RepID=A0A653CQY1_CALMS|nr:unnamed protein product [Callosobruchus maculatus]